MKKNPVYIALLAFLSVFAPFFADAGSPSVVKSQSVLNGPGWSFRENKGQLMDVEDAANGGKNQKPLTNIPFYGHQGGVNIYCKPGQISFVFTKTENDNDNKISEATGQPDLTTFKKLSNLPPKSAAISAIRADLVLLGSNPNAQITPSALQTYYENYYTTGDANHGITNVRTYKTVTYKDIYPNIDMVLEAKPNSLEYSFIVYPGGNVADIQLQWNGLNDIKQLENGGIAYSLPNFTTSLREGPTESSLTTAVVGITRNPLDNTTPARTFTETPPVCYLAADNFSKVSNFGKVVPTIPSSFTRHGSRISFSVPHYDKSRTLIIDPTLDWGTYYGAGGWESGSPITIDANNNIYITGNTISSSGIATSGAYQTSLEGGQDAFIAKFNSTGSLIWGTYYGGNAGYMNGNWGTAITHDANNNIYITGYTQSDNGIATSGAYQTVLAGGTGSIDAFVAKFTSSGTLSWGTYYGGGNDDYANGITADANNNIYITGWTQSTRGIATSGAYQTTPGGGFLAKFTSTGSLSWATYFNGLGYGITADVNNNVYITGLTGSTSGIATTGAYQTSLIGTGDAFVVKFTSSGSLSWGTYYGGSGNIDGGNCGRAITHDFNNNIYITGFTSSTSDIATTGAYQTRYGKRSNYPTAFVAKFSSKGALTWGTYYGANGNSSTPSSGIGIITDINNNVYITGNTVSDSGIATTDAYQTNYAGAGGNGFGDAFVAKFDSTCSSLLWGTYYGGSGDDQGEGIINDANNNIYISGWTQSASGIITPGAYQTRLAGGTNGTDFFVAKFSIPTTEIMPIISAEFDLKTAPNPFKGQTTISYTLPQYQNVLLTLTDITRKQIAILTNENQNPGLHTYILDAEKYNIPAGTYFLRMVAGGEAVEQKIVRIR